MYLKIVQGSHSRYIYVDEEENIKKNPTKKCGIYKEKMVALLLLLLSLCMFVLFPLIPNVSRRSSFHFGPVQFGFFMWDANMCVRKKPVVIDMVSLKVIV